MIAKYNKKLYSYIANAKINEILTRHEEKADSSFTRNGNVWYKNVKEKDLQDIFTVRFFVSYDAGFPGTPTEWEIADVKDSLVTLVFADGLLPGWDIGERNVCVKCIPISSFTCVKAIYSFLRSDGISFRIPEISEVDIPASSLATVYDDYRLSNM